MDIQKLAGEMWMKIKLVIGLIVAGMAVGAIAWRNHVLAGLDGVEQQAKEEAIKQEAAKKLAEETARLEAERVAKEAALEAEKKQKEQQLAAEIKEKAEKLKKASSTEVKKEAAAVLGLKEKKKGKAK